MVSMSFPVAVLVSTDCPSIGVDRAIPADVEEQPEGGPLLAHVVVGEFVNRLPVDEERLHEGGRERPGGRRVAWGRALSIRASLMGCRRRGGGAFLGEDQWLGAQRPPLSRVPDVDSRLHQTKGHGTEHVLGQAVLAEERGGGRLHLLGVVPGEVMGQAIAGVVDSLEVGVGSRAKVARLSPLGIDRVTGFTVHPLL
jgi:hypothetical protein